MLHASGFFHEQARPDRDEHVKILLENIPEKFKSQFEMHTEKEIDTMGLPYDLGRLKLTQMFYFSQKIK